MSKYNRYVRTINNFPKEGISFKDINPIFEDPIAFEVLINDLAQRTPSLTEYVIGIEARGFTLGAALAYRLGAGFIPIRKKGKLPPPTMSVTYDKEYGTDELEISIPSEDKRGAFAIVVDDILATGGTVLAAHQLASTYYTVRTVLFAGEIPSLGGGKELDKLNIPYTSLMKL